VGQIVGSRRVAADEATDALNHQRHLFRSCIPCRASDDRDHVPRRRRIYRYLRYRNRRVGQEDHPLTRIRSIRPIKLDRH